jgi:hypothetical protein
LVDKTSSSTAISCSVYSAHGYFDHRLRIFIAWYGLGTCAFCLGLCFSVVCGNGFSQSVFLQGVGSQWHKVSQVMRIFYVAEKPMRLSTALF